MMRLTQHRNYESIFVALADECSWRAAVRTRWLNKIRPAGASGGPDSKCRDHWKLQKKTWNIVVPPANTTLAYNSKKCRASRWLLYQ